MIWTEHSQRCRAAKTPVNRIVATIQCEAKTVQLVLALIVRQWREFIWSRFVEIPYYRLTQAPLLEWEDGDGLSKRQSPAMFSWGQLCADNKLPVPTREGCPSEPPHTPPPPPLEGCSSEHSEETKWAEFRSNRPVTDTGISRTATSKFPSLSFKPFVASQTYVPLVCTDAVGMTATLLPSPGCRPSGRHRSILTSNVTIHYTDITRWRDDDDDHDEDAPQVVETSLIKSGFVQTTVMNPEKHNNNIQYE